MLRERALQLEQRQGGGKGSTATQEQSSKTPVTLFSEPRPFGIVDGELVEILGVTDIPGMSPAYICSDEQGWSAPVPFRETRIFTNPRHALGVLQKQ